MVFCRNLFIYFESATVERVVREFAARMPSPAYLCVAAAESLLPGMGMKPDDIDAIVFATMTPDYRVPSTACILQDRLRCSSRVDAYDDNKG